jgi:hypothetical protein
MARVLIVGGEARALQLARAVAETGHAVRVVVRAGAPGGTPAGAEHPESEHPTLELFPADPSRLATLRRALEQVTLACWLFGAAPGTSEELTAWHGALLEAFMRQMLDSSARGFLYEAAGGARAELRAQGERLATDFAARHAIAFALIESETGSDGTWLEDALAATLSLLEPR